MKGLRTKELLQGEYLGTDTFRYQRVGHKKSGKNDKQPGRLITENIADHALKLLIKKMKIYLEW